MKASQLNAATFVTISRFFLVPVFIYFFLIENFHFAVATLVIASATDILDGFLARKLNLGTELGSVLDPLADKFLMMVSFIALSVKDSIPWWCTLIIIGRDVYIVLGLVYLYFLKKLEIKISPSLLSKRTTFAQFMLLTFSFLNFFLVKNAFDLDDFYSTVILLAFYLQFALIYIAALLTAVTFVQYTVRGLAILKNGKPRNI